MSEKFNEEPAPAPAPEIALFIACATSGRGLALLRDVVRVWAGAKMNCSATDRGGDRGKDVRRGRLPGELVIESRCLFLTRVGMNSGPSSCDRNREESNDSRSTTWKFGEVRYVTETDKLPIGWGTAENSCTSCASREFWTKDSRAG